MNGLTTKALNNISFAKAHIWERKQQISDSLLRSKLEHAREMLGEVELIIKDVEDAEPMKGQTDLEELGLTVRAYNCLRRTGISTIEELCVYSEHDVMKIRGLGYMAYTEIVDKLKARGLKLR